MPSAQTMAASTALPPQPLLNTPSDSRGQCPSPPCQTRRRNDRLVPVSAERALRPNLIYIQPNLQCIFPGTCSECFGSGYTLCPSSSITCYLPGDSIYGLDSCDSSSSSTGSDPAYPTTTGSAGAADVCSGVAATCVSCFGAGYLDCGNGVDCYNPAGKLTKPLHPCRL